MKERVCVLLGIGGIGELKVFTRSAVEDKRADQSGLVRSTGRYQTLNNWVVEVQAL